MLVSFFIVLSPPLAFHKIRCIYVNAHPYVGRAQKAILSVAYSLGFVWVFYR